MMNYCIIWSILRGIVLRSNKVNIGLKFKRWRGSSLMKLITALRSWNGYLLLIFVGYVNFLRLRALIDENWLALIIIVGRCSSKWSNILIACRMSIFSMLRYYFLLFTKIWNRSNNFFSDYRFFHLNWLLIFMAIFYWRICFIVIFTVLEEY